MNEFRIYISGVGGVGKTTIAQKLARRHHMKYFSGSWIMMKLCRVNSREELSGMSKKRKMIVEKMEYPLFVIRNRRVIIDGHCELFPEQAKCFDGFIFLTAPADIIKARRQQRGDRRRDTNVQMIAIEQKEYRLRVRKTEQKCRIKFTTVSNIGSITKTCELIEKALE